MQNNTAISRESVLYFLCGFSYGILSVILFQKYF